MSNQNQNITIQTKQPGAGQNAWNDGMVKTTASQVAEEANRKFVTGIEKNKIQSIPTSIDGIPLAGQDSLNRLYITGDPAGNGVKTVNRVNAGVGPLPVIENGASIFVFVANGHNRTSLLINIEGGTPYPVKYFGNTNTAMLGQILSNTLLELHFLDQAWHIIGALDYTALINSKVSANNPIVGGTATKVNYDAKGLITGSSILIETDIPPIPIDKVIGLTQVIATLSDTTITDNLQAQINTKITSNNPVVPNTATKITYDEKGLVTSGTNLIEADIPSISISKTRDLQTALDAKVTKNATIIPGTATKVSYDTKGLILSGDVLTASDIPALTVSKITGLQAALDAKMASNISIAPATATKVTYDAKGLITSGSNLVINDIPDIPMAKVSGLVDALSNVGSADAITNLQTQMSTKLDKNNTIAGGTKTKISYDTKGLVIAGEDLTVADIPSLTISKITNLQTILDSKLEENSLITGGTKTKITYDAKGLVTDGTNLTAADIPVLSVSKITGLQAALDSKAIASNVSASIDTLNAEVDTKITANNPIVPGTATKVTYDSKGLIINSDSLASSDIPNIAVSQVTGLQTSLDSKLNKNATIGAATKTKITYDDKGLITAGADLTATDIPTLAVSKIANLQIALDSKVDENPAITANTVTKVTYDTKGLVTGGTNLTKDDIPNIEMSQVNGLTVNLYAKADKQYVDDLIISTQLEGATQEDLNVLRNDLNTSIATKVNKNNDIEAGTKTKISYDTKGLVTGGTNLLEADIPTLSISKTQNLQSSLNSKLDKNVLISPGTSTKVTYDAKGLVTAGTELGENDIPELQITKINGLQDLLDDKVAILNFNNTVSNLNNRIDTKFDIPIIRNPGNAVTKVWYDSHGIVTAGDYLTVDDLPSPIPVDKIGGLVESLDNNLLTDISFDYDDQDTTIVLTSFNVNPLTLAQNFTNVDMPVASEVKPGIMPKESFAQLVQNTADIAAMKLANRRWAINGAIIPDDTTAAGQTALNTAYISASGNPAPRDADTLLYVEAGNTAFTWFSTSNKWVYRGTDTASKATNTSLGLVQGINSNGKIFVENDGTMSLVGYNALTSADASLLATVNTKVASNSVITSATKTKITYDAKGLVTAGTDLVAGDIPVLAISKITNLQVTLDGKSPVSHASSVSTYGVASAVNYGHAMAGSNTPLASDVLPSPGTDNGKFAREDHIHPVQTTISGNAGSATKLATSRNIAISGDVTGNGNFDGTGNLNIIATVVDDSHAHIIANIDGLQAELNTKAVATDVNASITSLNDAIITKVEANNAIIAATKTKITYDAKGLVTAGTDLTTADIPSLEITKIIGLANALNGKVTANSNITAGTATKITYDAKGLVTAGTNLTAADIPALDWSKISTGKPTTVSGYGITDALKTTGGTMTGSVNFTEDQTGMSWSRNTDFASIKFYNTGDQDPDARLEFAIGDNDNEFFSFVSTLSGGGVKDLLKIRPNGGADGLTFLTKKVWNAGNFDPATKADVHNHPYLTIAAANNTDGQWDFSTTTPTGTQRLNYSGELWATRVVNATWNDYAEYFRRGETDIGPGDIIMVSEDQIGNETTYIRTSGEYSKLVAGVVSDSWGHMLGGDGLENVDERYVAVGLAGRVRLKVTGKVRKGDLIVSSNIRGVGMASNGYIPGTVIAKALENHDGNEISRISALILNM